MVGDGVNDVQALKQADLGIAMGSGSQSSRSVARIVLLDSSFAAVPQVLDEGRRVIANIERVANLFVTKTVYAAVLAMVVAITAVPYPFFPRHLTVVSTLTIGIPGFFLAFAAGAPRAAPGSPAGCFASRFPPGSPPPRPPSPATPSSGHGPAPPSSRPARRPCWRSSRSGCGCSS